MAETAVRSWRTAFLTLRDETLTSPPTTPLSNLLCNLIFSQHELLVSAAANLPPHEVVSDILFLVELVQTSPLGGEVADMFIHACKLIHDISCHIHLEMNSSSWVIMFGFLEKMVEQSVSFDIKTVSSGNAARAKAIREVLDILRKCSLSGSSELVKLLLHIVACSQAGLVSSSRSSSNQWYAAEIGTRIPKSNSLWEVQTIAFSMIADALSKVGSSISVDVWQSTLEVLRRVMDGLASGHLVEDSAMSRFYTTLLRCLHLVLSEPKGSLSEHVAGFVAALRMFFTYGLNNRSLLVLKEKEFSSLNIDSKSDKSSKSCKTQCSGPYRPPHLRRREGTSMQPLKAWDHQNIADHEPSGLGFTSSDSEHSDSDRTIKDTDHFQCSKARTAAIICIQDLCEADPKSLTAHWAMLLPTNDVLQLRKYQATLMTCLIFDPVLKTRIASASALAAMLDGPSSVFLQVAEHRDSTKCGSFTTLSSSLGQILMQLHTGLLYLIQHETHNGLVASLFKVLTLLISATPYARMHEELLTSVISTVHKRIIEDFSSRTDQTGLVVAGLSCLGAAFSTSPSLQVAKMLQEETSTGAVEAQVKSNELSSLFQFSQNMMHPTICFEALQVLRATSHNYPNTMTACWEQVSNTVYGLLRVSDSDCSDCEVLAHPWKGDIGNASGSTAERRVMAAIRVLDECLRAASGFKGIDELLDDRLLDTAFMSDCTRRKKVSSAPSFGFDGSEVLKSNSIGYSCGVKQWCDAIKKHLPLTLLHNAPTVRAATITCFAGITSSVFFLLRKEDQNFIHSSTISAAINDEVPSVRAAACRAIGVIACFPQIFQSLDILDEFIHAVEINVHHHLVSVRVTASWALANVCDSLRHSASNLRMGAKDYSGSISLLAECALQLTKDGDKIKSNAVRALGNLSRFVSFNSQSSICNGSVDGKVSSLTTEGVEFLPSRIDTESNDLKAISLGDPHWLERMVRAFVSCVTTGNVKVQWNVCHALGNLFLNETLRLQDMVWAPSVYSILLLLLRDSTNFKIKIHAAHALAVPTSREDYGSSFSDVVQGVQHILENLSSDRSLTPSSFKYMATLEKQLTSTALHMLGLTSHDDPQPLQDFLAKKASFLEEWFKLLLSSLTEITSDQPAPEATMIENQQDASLSGTQKKAMVSKALRSLLEMYSSSKQHKSIARRFEKLIDCLS